MRSRVFITDRPSAVIGLAALVVLICVATFNAQTVALVTPLETPLDKIVAEGARAALSGAFRVQDLSMSDAAFGATGRGSAAFNMTTDDAQGLGSVLGCDLFVLIKTGTQRRASIDGPDHFESFASFFVVSSRTGRLIKWQLVSENGTSEKDAQHRMTQSDLVGGLLDTISTAWNSERRKKPAPQLEQIPEERSPAAKNFRPPVPYVRLKPEYTRTAYLYDVTATVEATVDLDEKGSITRLEITRWAGYGLDESVAKAIRSMNWRPAERNGSPLPIRFLLRYNFKKIEKEGPENE